MSAKAFQRICNFILVIIGLILLFQWCGKSKTPDTNVKEIEIAEEIVQQEKNDNKIPQQNADKRPDANKRPDTDKSQEGTFFYRLMSIIENGAKTDGADNNGQFITFIQNTCFESDKFGKDVENGCLSLIESESSMTETFTGKAFWGDNCKFVFTNDRKSLRVYTPSGAKIIYHRSTPPEGMTTCSLIRSQQEMIQQMFMEESMRLEAQRIENLNKLQRKNNEKTKTNDVVRKSHTCPYCNGCGKITVFSDQTAGFGLSPVYKECHICHKKVNINGGGDHKHMCTHCNGSGKK